MVHPCESRVILPREVLAHLRLGFRVYNISDMLTEMNRQAPSKNEQEIVTFQFSESKQQVRNILLENKPWFVAKDVCDVLGLEHTTNALKSLDDDEKLTVKLLQSGQHRNMWIISESGLYALILRSNKPYAKNFRKWITSEVIPTLLKRGYYSMNFQRKTEFTDARDIPFNTEEILGFNIRVIVLDNVKYYSINDINAAIRSSTNSSELAKKLNVKKKLAHKIWIFGNTHPAWFVNKLGFQLILSGSRIYNRNTQLSINFDA